MPKQATKDEKIVMLESALDLAISVIETYQRVIRQNECLMDKGFCQGGVFSNSISAIRFMSDGIRVEVQHVKGKSEAKAENDG